MSTRLTLGCQVAGEAVFLGASVTMLLQVEYLNRQSKIEVGGHHPSEDDEQAGLACLSSALRAPGLQLLEGTLWGFSASTITRANVL
jgi:hypothetical protein